ncbi:response regulator [Altererythrobacter soli]|uniref:Response regulator n=1 Tax=Croceibacterium soli TaxID=1739690 RepID=A0A6I4UU82_9SPHN|nr:response regulator [Croceibacterium soli]MXP42198.1 response regulator [Croceibacterium soli]
MNNDLGDPARAVPTGADAAPNPVRRVLLVEDSMLIALDAEETLIQGGIDDVAVAGNVAAALAQIEKQMPDFALLDFNLGNETSEAVAEVLTNAGVPYCYATGYGDALERMSLAPPCGVLTKPYSKDDIMRAVARAAELISKS